MKLKVKRDYTNREHQYQKGEVIEVPDEVGAWLQRDSESTFAEVKPRRPRRSMKKPPADKAVTEAVEK